MAATERSSSEGQYAPVLWEIGQRVLKLPGVARFDLARIALIELANIGLGVAGPFALKTLIDGFNSPSAQAGPMMFWAGLFVATWAAAGVLSTWRLVYSTRLIDRLTGTLINDALAGELPRSATKRDADSGKTLGLLERLPFSLLIVVDGVIWRILPLAIQVSLSLWVIAGLIPLHYALVLLIVLAGHGVVSWFGAVRHRDHAEAATLAASTLSRLMGDLLRNARRVVLNGALRMELSGVAQTANAKTAANRSMMWSLVWGAVIQYGWLGIGVAALLFAGTTDVIAGRMTVGDFVMLETYALRLAMPLSSVGFILSQSASSIATVREVLALRPQDTGNYQMGIEPPAGAARVELEGVSFHYDGSASGIDDVSATLKPGSFNVIVGANGSGKSTLAQVMAGIFKPDKGRVLISGQDLAEIPPEERHRWVIYVPQFISLFNRSLGENARYPPTRTSEAVLTNQLRHWRFYEAGRDLNMGLMAGEFGERFSGGQVQKLELARVAGMRVPVLILDESTSALDPNSEADILSELRRQFQGETTIVMVTHRAKVAEVAETVLYMSDGRLLMSGRHLALLSKTAYRQIWRA